MSEKQALLQDQKGQPPSAPAPPVDVSQLPQYPPAYQQYQGETPQAQQPPPTGQTIIVTNNAPTVFEYTPVHLRCSNCQTDVITSVNYESGLLTWLLVLLLFLLGFCLCSCIPCCISATKDVIHTCPNCRHICGVHKRIG